MRPADEVEVVSVEELGDDVRAEGEGDAAVVLAPTHRVLKKQSRYRRLSANRTRTQKLFWLNEIIYVI